MRVALACAFAYGVLAAFGAPAEAQVIADMVNSIPLAFDNVRGMEDALRRIAWITFASLVFIEVAFALGNLWMDGNASLPNILGLLFRQGLMIGFFALLIQAGPDFCRSIILTMVQAGNDASQAIGGSRNMSPGDVIGIGSNMVGRIWGAMEWSPKSLVLAGCGAVIIWTFSEIVCAIIEVTIEGFLFASWSALMMGFGGSSYTREIAVAQLRLALGIGAKRFVLQCIVGLGENLINGWAAGMKAGRLDYVQCISMVVVSIVVYRLAQRLPQRAQDMINGSHTGGGGTGKGGLAHAGKEGVEKAAKAGIATTAMGAAAVAAYDQARAQLEATGGGSGGGSSGGSGGGGGATGSSSGAAQGQAPGSQGGHSGRSGGFGASLARGAKLAGMTASNLGQAATTDFGRRMAGDRQAGQGYLGARMARIAAAEAERTRAQAPQPANTP